MQTDVDLRELAIDRPDPAAGGLRPKRHVMTRYVLPGLLIAGFAALVAWAGRDLVFPPRRVTVVPVLATTANVQREGTPLFQAAGWIEPRPTPIRVAALAQGVVEKLLVVEDQAVQAGEPVAELVKDDAQLSYEKARADLRLRQAESEQATAAHVAATLRFEQPVHLEAALGEAEAALSKVATTLADLPFAIRRAQADLEFARKDLEGKTAAGDAVAGRAVDEAKSNLDSAQAQLEELSRRNASLEAEKKALVRRRDALATRLELLADETEAKDSAAAHVAAAGAQVKQAEVALAEAKLRLDRMTVRAPVDGRVYQLVAYPGTTLAGSMGRDHGSSTVVTLYRPESLQVRVDVRFEDIPKVRLGQPVRIANPALQSPLAGRVLFVSSEADIQKNTLEVKVAIDSPQPVFKPEMLVDVTFLAPKSDEQAAEPTEAIRLYIPQDLLHDDETGSFVWLADQTAGVARKTTVETGAASGDGLIEVTSGLTPSSRLIADGIQGLADGDRVRVEQEGYDKNMDDKKMEEGQSNRQPEHSSLSFFCHPCFCHQSTNETTHAAG